jgi:RND family efflux transporter MFP subunit
VITAPYAGVVAETHAEVGDMAAPGRSLVTLYEPGRLRVTATLAQATLAAVKRDAPVRVEIPVLGRTLTATGVTVLPVADARTHTSKVRLDLPSAEGLLPGQFARARFVTGRVRKLVVPAEAVVRRSEVTAVYVSADARAPQMRQVRLGEAVGDGWIEVLAGVRDGERVLRDPVAATTQAGGAKAPGR